MEQDQTPINGRARRRGLSVAAESAGMWLEERLLWPVQDALKPVGELLRHCFEYLAWAVRRWLIWPVQDRGGSLGTPGRVIAAVAAVMVIALGAAVVIGTTSDGGGPAASEVAVVTSEPPAVATTKPAPVEAEPTLEGAAPVFKPTKEEKKTAEQKPASPAPTAPAGSDPATATIGTRPGSVSAPAASSSSTAQSAIGVDGPPAGPEAIAVAEDFAGAFVLYETGGEESTVRKAFAATATPELAKSLLRRPPRLPADVEVPRARVVNVVAGPSHGGVYTISVSLLRVGLTSELRLDMEKLKNEWRVTNVLG